MRTHPDDSPEDPVPPALTAQEARLLREQRPPLAAWKVVVAQAVAGLLVAVAAGLLSGSREVAGSVAYGALAVVIPAAVFARALARRSAAGVVGAGFLGWQIVKIFLTVALLLAAPRLVPGLNWLGLLGGVVVATKMYWVALAAMRRRGQNRN
jgi:ATP synthase protein I